MSVASLSIPREAIISFGINATLSLAFFLLVFGPAPRVIGWSAPDALAFDFVPQSIAVALMSALVPALIVRRRCALGVPIRLVVLRAMGFAIAGAVLGGLLVWTVQGMGVPPTGWGIALTLKLLYGGSLGALITTLALKRMTR